MNRTLSLVILFSLLLLSGFPGCSGNSNLPAKLTVTVGMGILREWATEVAGPDADIVMLEGDGGSAHHFTPNLQDQGRIRNSHVLLGLGLELDPWTEKIADESKTSGVPKEVWHTGEWVERRKLTCHHDHDDHDHKDHEHHHHGDDDPHVWLDPERAAKIVTKLGDEFARMDAPHAAGYKQRAQAYAAKLTELSTGLTKLNATLKGKKVVTFHDAYGYLFERLGVEVVGVVQVAPGVEPSLRDVQEALKLMKGTNQKAVFAEPGAESSARTIAKELNLNVAILDPLETTASAAGKTYIERMKENLRVLEENLK